MQRGKCKNYGKRAHTLFPTSPFRPPPTGTSKHTPNMAFACNKAQALRPRAAATRASRASRVHRAFATATAPNSSSGAGEKSTTGIVNVDVEDVLPLRTLRDKLTPKQSPFVIDNNGGVGFVDENDRVMLNALHYGSDVSAGATCINGA